VGPVLLFPELLLKRKLSEALLKHKKLYNLKISQLIRGAGIATVRHRIRTVSALKEMRREFMICKTILTQERRRGNLNLPAILRKCSNLNLENLIKNNKDYDNYLMAV
jgi:hypothetical protein